MPLRVALAGVPAAVAFAVSDASFAAAAAAFGLGCLCICAPSAASLAVTALAAAFVTLTLWVFLAASADALAALSDFDLRSSAETFGRRIDAALLAGCLLVFLRTPDGTRLARIGASAAGTFSVSAARTARTVASAPRVIALAATLAAALVTLALVVVHAFSTLPGFDLRSFGWTVDAVLLLAWMLTKVRAWAAWMLTKVRAWAAHGANVLAAKLTFAGALVALALAATYASSAAVFSDFDVRTIAALGGTFCAALFLIPSNALLALATAAGVTTAHGVFTDLWATEPAFVLLLGAMSGFALFVAFRVIEDRPRAGWLSAAALAALAAVLAGHADPYVDEPVPGDVSNIRDVSLSRTPNLYFISFDSLVPRALLKKYFGVDGTGFHTLFDAKFRRFPNLFVNAVPTRESLYTVLALDPRVQNSQMTAGYDPGTFSGRSPSPLLGILSENGYETSTLFDYSYLGRHKGPWVDDYVFFRERTLCGLLAEAIRPWAFWGYCRWPRDESNDFIFSRFLERITSVDAGGNRFTMAHLYIPGHTDSSYRHGDAAAFERYRARYLRDIETAAEYLDRIVRHVEEDPDAILLLYSDHGMLLSQGMEFEDDPEFFVQDRYGVLGGVFPPEACAPWFDAAAAPGWMTLLDAVHAVLYCLSDGRGALVEPRTYVIDPGGYPATRPPSGYRRSATYADFDDFLYE